MCSCTDKWQRHLYASRSVVMVRGHQLEDISISEALTCKERRENLQTKICIFSITISLVLATIISCLPASHSLLISSILALLQSILLIAGHVILSQCEFSFLNTLNIILTQGLYLLGPLLRHCSSVALSARPFLTIWLKIPPLNILCFLAFFFL